MRFAVVGAFALLTTFYSPAYAAQSGADEYQKIVRNVAQHERDKYLAILMTDDPDPIDLCVQSGIVAQAWLEAGDVGKYDGAKKTEKYWCDKAYKPRR